MPDWDNFLTERDKKVFEAAGYGKRQGYGKNPAIVVVDVNYNFVGDTPEPILDSIKKYRNSCGEEGWQGVYHTSDCWRWPAKTACPSSTARPRHDILP